MKKKYNTKEEKLAAANANMKRYYAADPEKFRERARRYRLTRPATYKTWYERNRESCLEYGRNYYYTSSALRKNAKFRGLEFDLPDGLVADLMSDNCFYCGASPSPRNGIDRVDNARGYTEDNVVTACKVCNIAKGRQLRADFEAWAKRVVLRAQTSS